MEWQIIVALAVAIPVILLAAAFVWYLTVSGLYQVIRDSRQRQRRRAEALKEAERVIRGKVTVGIAPKEG